jgi:hypothetical protein
MPTVTNVGTVPNLWTTEYLSDLAIEAERIISTEVNCIYIRFALPVTVDVSIYDFSTLSTPQYLTGILRISYLGWTVWPVFPNEMRNQVVPFKPGNGDVASRPFLYLRQGYGLNSIKLFPAPNATIAYDGSDLNSQAGVRANVVVSGWRVADPSTSYRIPAHVRQTLVRYYVLAKAFKKEGKGQNLQASQYFSKKYEKLLDRFKTINGNLFACRVPTIRDGGVVPFGYKPPRPSLPPNFPRPRY